MAIAVKPLDASAAKWSQRAQGAAGEYATNAQASAQRWLANAVAGQPTFQQAITAAGLPARWARGIQKAGSAKFTRGITEKGASRFSEGVGVAQQDWQTGFQPYAQRLASVTLSTRRPRGDRANYRRVEEVGVALNAQRLAALGTGT